MVHKEDIFNVNFYKKERFHGSDRGLHYRIERVTPEEGDPEFRVTTWPGPFICDKTPEEYKKTASFPFTNEALADIADYLNREREEREDFYTTPVKDPL